jgi:glycosyltransferase involved in cell wall biosynthesis
MHVIYSGRKIPDSLPFQERRPEHVFRLTWVGRLEGHKDPDTVVAAVRLLPPDVLAHFELAVVGSGAEAERIGRSSAGLPVRMIGGQDNGTALAWMASGDAFVLSSRYEPFGLVVLEAMGLGIPVIASAEGGPSEIIEDGVNGLLFPQGDAHALRDAILRLMSDRDLHGRLKLNGLRRFEDFPTDRMGERLRLLYAG